MTIECGEDPESPISLLHNDTFRHWINRQLSDLYRAQHRDDPPAVSRKKGKGYCYPPELKPVAAEYLRTWKSGEKV